ncbi:MAG TPA: transcription termination/antitermination protein NusA [Candidatus Moranbacteria bacterium]|nr:transcription termination/antitermination protein NusA [Candidatus Moranbacteria bacterium]
MSELSNTIKQICEEKGLSLDAVVGTIESALAAAYRKDFGEKNQNIKVEFDIDNGKSKVFDIKTVVEDMPEEPSDAPAIEGKEDTEVEDKKTPLRRGSEVQAENRKQTTDKKEGKRSEEDGSGEEDEERKFNPRTEIQISDAKLKKKTSKVGDEIITKLGVPGEFGRMAAQTAKQVIIQRLREAERDMIFNEFKEKEHEVISGAVQRREGRIVLIDLGKSVGVLSGEEQIYGEQYKPGARIKVYVKEVRIGSRGPEIILSRTSDEILKKIFYLEIPEISNGLVDLKSVAREAGSRSKVAVAATSDNIDPIGSCVGQRGARIQTVINELGGEKVDIIEYDDDPQKFIGNSLSPAKILSIELDEKKKEAVVMVVSDQLSLAIGKGGQNVRLAARLTGWKIDIKENKAEPSSAEATEDKKEEESDKEEDNVKKDKKEDKKDEKNENTDDMKEDKKKVKKKKDEKEKKEDKKKTPLRQGSEGQAGDSKQEKEVKEKKKDDKKEDKKDVKPPSAKALEDKKDKKVKEKKDDKKEKNEK